MIDGRSRRRACASPPHHSSAQVYLAAISATQARRVVCLCIPPPACMRQTHERPRLSIASTSAASSWRGPQWHRPSSYARAPLPTRRLSVQAPPHTVEGAKRWGVGAPVGRTRQALLAPRTVPVRACARPAHQRPHTPRLAPRHRRSAAARARCSPVSLVPAVSPCTATRWLRGGGCDGKRVDHASESGEGCGSQRRGTRRRRDCAEITAERGGVCADSGGAEGGGAPTDASTDGV